MVWLILIINLGRHVGNVSCWLTKKETFVININTNEKKWNIIMLFHQRVFVSFIFLSSGTSGIRAFFDLSESWPFEWEKKLASLFPFARKTNNHQPCLWVAVLQQLFHLFLQVIIIRFGSSKMKTFLRELDL